MNKGGGLFFPFFGTVKQFLTILVFQIRCVSVYINPFYKLFINLQYLDLFMVAIR